MAHKKLISSRINHFGQESVYLPNVSKYINQIDGPIEQITYLNRKYTARRYRWLVPWLIGQQPAISIWKTVWKQWNSNTKILMHPPFPQPSIQASHLQHGRAITSFPSTSTYPSGHSPPHFWHSGPAEPSYQSRGHRAFPQAERCRTCTHNRHEWGPQWSSPAGSTAPEESRTTEIHISQVALGFHVL